MWQKIDPKNPPEDEVLAGNFGPGTYGYKEKLIGYIHKGNVNEFIAENENEVLYGVTHFVDIHKFDPV